jgi:hypothetical protein
MLESSGEALRKVNDEFAQAVRAPFDEGYSRRLEQATQRLLDVYGRIAHTDEEHDDGEVQHMQAGARAGKAPDMPKVRRQ